MRSSLWRSAGVEEILHPDPDPGGTVRVGGPDPPVRRPDPLPAQARLRRPVQGDVVRQDDVRGVRDPHPGGVDPARRQAVELADERGRVHDDTRSDERHDVRVEDPRRDEMELEDLLPEHDRVAGVVAALVADHPANLLGQEVGRLALALVAPLEPDDHRGRHHGPPSVGPRAARRQ
jgi:hypothetical protein